uniref:Bifunctional inhibitor/plant lipid transfer protein/seed storage helical domain-containing protein n=1 Tax=Kalanchoe fedtschenkoi TaxID=63787 RepID=A0A7N0V2G6_KALFE
MSGGGTQKSFRKALGAIKDRTTVGLATINSDYKELDVAIVKATNHVERPAKERHIKAIFTFSSASRPRADVAYCIHGLARRLAKTLGGLPPVGKLPPVGGVLPPVGGLPPVGKLPPVGGVLPPVGGLPPVGKLPPVGAVLPPVGGLPPVGKLPPVGGVLPPVGGLPPTTKPGPTPCAPPKVKPAKCPINTLKLGACVDLLGGAVNVKFGDPVVNTCCPVLKGLAEVEAAACLCTCLKAKALNLKVYVPIAVQLLLSCGKTLPPGYTCSI